MQHVSIPQLPATPPKLETYRQAQINDLVCARVREYCKSQWPGRDSIKSAVKPYWKVRGSLSLCDNLLLYNHRIVVPPALRRETMMKLHEGHQGVERSRLRTNTLVWLPCVNSQVKEFVENCRECALSLCDNLLLYNHCIVVPPALRRETMMKAIRG